MIDEWFSCNPLHLRRISVSKMFNKCFKIGNEGFLGPVMEWMIALTVIGIILAIIIPNCLGYKAKKDGRGNKYKRNTYVFLSNSDLYEFF